MSLPADPASAAVARRFVRDALASWGADEFEEPAVLLTSELVTNALLHARAAPELVVRLVGGHLRIGVIDAVPTAPLRKHYGTGAATGRGLLLIEAMADAWGTDPDGEGGKVVWFELASPEKRPATSSAARLGSSTDSANGGSDDIDTDEHLDRRRPSGGPRASARRRPLRRASGTRRTSVLG